MTQQSEVLYIKDLAAMLGKTESAVREGVRRGVPWLPKSFRMGTHHAWLREDLHTFLRDQRDGKNAKPKPGRKRNEPPVLRKVG